MPLDASQKAFIQASSRSNIRLLAPAGCGKTLCLLHRCKHLARRLKARPNRFLILTFTRAAKWELETRIAEDAQFASLADLAEITTLNAWGWRRSLNAYANLKPPPLESHEYHSAMKNRLSHAWERKGRENIRRAMRKWGAPGRRIMQTVDGFMSLGFDHTRHANPQAFSDHMDSLYDQKVAPRLIALIDDLNEIGILDIDIKRLTKRISKANKRKIYRGFFEFWVEVCASLIENRIFTFDVQKYGAYLIERDALDSGNLTVGDDRYLHVFVDEFQDINPLDIALIETIVKRNRATLTISGDDDQAIFEWRGAAPEYILSPEKRLGIPFETHTLGVNYRSPANIVERSQNLIANNSRRVEKDVAARIKRNARLHACKTVSIERTLNDVYERVISPALAESAPGSTIGIIGRTQSQLIPYQIYFASKGVPFYADVDLQVLSSGTLKKVLEVLTIKRRSRERLTSFEAVAYMLSLANLVFRYPLNQDEQKLEKRLSGANPDSLASALDALYGYRGSLRGANKDGKTSAKIGKAISAFIAANTVSDALIALDDGFDGLSKDSSKGEDDIFFKAPPIVQLAEYARSYGDDYGAFVNDLERARHELSHAPPVNGEDANGSEDAMRRPVHLMTAWRAKGKEFDTTVLLDVIDGVWPDSRAQTPEEREAERRLFYVAFTRARKWVVILTGDRSGKYPDSPYIAELGDIKRGWPRRR